MVASADHGHTDLTRPGFYLGAGAGLNSLNGEDYTGPSNDRVEDEKVSFKAFAGTRLNPVVSLEAAYIDFGTAEDGGNRVDARSVDVESLNGLATGSRVRVIGNNLHIAGA